ncbi:MAG: adenylyl-sulfate kinase [Gammaproteobacteria bacterium]|nr:adenylyl-sulfate kinase [Gammaproteobacteria bacterium]MYC53497.1 adenylyl-sulfate kinase [Gammaproteobacteria bacterium]
MASGPAAVRPPLRFVLCGAVDDGKSTLLGRLLCDCRQVFADQMRKVEEDSRRWGTRGDQADLALLVDGLRDEREQGITIDVAYRSFETARRRFIVADAPGHEQYTRNMATGASNAELAVVVADARKGILPQTARHTRIAAMFGIRHVVLAVNKMDLVLWDRSIFQAIADEYRSLARDSGVENLRITPVSSLTGENLTRRRDSAGWYAGPTLLEHLETVDVESSIERESFRMSVQYVNRPDPDFRGYSGRVAAGRVAVGDRVHISPSGAETVVESIVVWQGARERAERGDSVTLTLANEVDVTRGDVIAEAFNPPGVTDQFQANLIWMSDRPLVVGRSYLLKIHSREVTATVTRIKYRLDVSRGSRLAGATLNLNDLGTVNIATNRPIPYAPFEQYPRLGSFIMIDPINNETAGAGTVNFALRRASNIRWQDFHVTREARQELKLQRARCLWLTGLPASGKSTIADLLEKRLHAEGHHTYLLDGDNVRHGLNRDLGFTEADRVENIRRVAEVARLMVDAGLIVIVSFISPFRSERAFARGLFASGDFNEIFVDASIEVCAARDPKGLYARAMRGQLRNFTGIDSPYEQPENPDLHLDTEKLGPEECVESILRLLV